MLAEQDPVKRAGSAKCLDHLADDAVKRVLRDGASWACERVNQWDEIELETILVELDEELGVFEETVEEIEFS